MSQDVKTRALLEPFDLRGLPLRNRVVMSSLTRCRAGEDRLPNAMMAAYYAQRAGAGLVLTEGTVVSRQAIGWPGTPGIYTDAQAGAWTQVVEAVHRAGPPIFLQLWHCGRDSHSDFHGGALPVAPSAIRHGGDGKITPLGSKDYETPRALETEEVGDVVGDFVTAAERALAAGFDGIEIQAGNGYLIDQFLQSRTNHRTDGYGGSIENRFRFLREIVEGVCGVFAADCVGVHLAPNGVYNDMGSPDYRETFTHAARQLETYGLAYLRVFDGLGFGFHGLGEPMTLEDFRAVFTGPLIGNCDYTRDTAEAAIGRGAADLIAFGRPFISNPDLVERFRAGWPLAPAADPSTWYAHTGAGYIDFPPYEGESPS